MDTHYNEDKIRLPSPPLLHYITGIPEILPLPELKLSANNLLPCQPSDEVT